MRMMLAFVVLFGLVHAPAPVGADAPQTVCHDAGVGAGPFGAAAAPPAVGPLACALDCQYVVLYASEESPAVCGFDAVVGGASTLRVEHRGGTDLVFGFGAHRTLTFYVAGADGEVVDSCWVVGRSSDKKPVSCDLDVSGVQVVRAWVVVSTSGISLVVAHTFEGTVRYNLI